MGERSYFRIICKVHLTTRKWRINKRSSFPERPSFVKMRFQGYFAYCFLIVLLVNLYGLESARYNGRTAENAGVILDRSQNSLCDGCGRTAFGHPRGHASYPNARGPRDSVENYSKSTGQQKSGFLSRSDQNLVAHHALGHSKSQDAMRFMNSGSFGQDVTLAARDFPIGLPKMKEYRNGAPSTGELNIRDVVVVLRHQAGRRSDRNADVFVQTLYPRKA